MPLPGNVLPLTDAAHDELIAAGWRARDDGWWIDPASGDPVPEWRVMDLYLRDRDTDLAGGAIDHPNGGE